MRLVLIPLVALLLTACSAKKDPTEIDRTTQQQNAKEALKGL
ncbi:MAG: hypothetical protein WCR69_01785 [Sulfuricurvum sp.]